MEIIKNKPNNKITRYNMLSDSDKQTINIRNLRKKTAIVATINAITLAFDMGLTYHINRLQVNKPRSVQTDKTRTFQYIINAIKPICYTLATIGDATFLTNNDGIVDTVGSDGVLTVDGNDVSAYTRKWPYLLLHLTKSAVRVAELINIGDS